MAQTAARLVDHLIPHVPVRQWVLSFPIPLRVLFAARPQLLTPVLEIIQRVIAGLSGEDCATQAQPSPHRRRHLIQGFGSAANLNIPLHCLVLDGVYRTGSQTAPLFHEARAPTSEELQAVLARIIIRILKMLTRHGSLIEEQGMTYLAEAKARWRAHGASQAASCAYRIALGPRARSRKCRACKRSAAERRSLPKPYAPTRTALRQAQDML